GDLRFAVDVDRKTNELALELSLTAKEKSTLAAGIASLGETPSLFGGMLGKDAPMSVLVHAALPESLRGVLGPVIDEAFRKELGKEKDEAKRQQSEKMLNALAPTLKAGELDAAFALRKAAKGDQFTAVMGMKLKDGSAVEKTLRDLVKDLPEA